MISQNLATTSACSSSHATYDFVSSPTVSPKTCAHWHCTESSGRRRYQLATSYLEDHTALGLLLPKWRSGGNRRSVQPFLSAGWWWLAQPVDYLMPHWELSVRGFGCKLRASHVYQTYENIKVGGWVGGWVVFRVRVCFFYTGTGLTA